MWKWTKTIAMTGALCALLLGACAGGGDGNNTTPQNIDLAPAQLVIYSTSGWTEEAFNARFGAIRTKFPQHTFQYIQSAANTRYPDLIAANQAIDIIWESVANFRTGPIQFETAYNMTDLMKKHNIDTSKLNKAMVDRMRAMSNGGMYALPVLNNTLSLYYNTDLFNRFGVPVPKDGMTWDEVYELNRRMTRTDGGVQYVGLSFSDSHYFAIHPIAQPLVDKSEKSTIANGKWNPLFDTFIQAANAPGYREKVRELKGVVGIRRFDTEKDAAMFAGLANSHLNLDWSSFNWNVVQFPTYKEAPKAQPQTYPTYFGVSATSKHKDQAMDVIKYLISDEFQTLVSRTGALPVVSSKAVIDAFAADTPHKDKNVKSALYAQFSASAESSEYDGVLWPIYRRNLAPLMLGEMDLNTVLRTAEEAAAKAIEEFKQK